MPDQPADPNSSNPSQTVPQRATAAAAYSERLYVPWWWWALGLGMFALLAWTIHLGQPKLPIWVPFLVLILPAWALVWLSRHRLEVAPDPDGTLELRTGTAHLPVTYVARAAAVPTSAKSVTLGRQLDPAAFVQHRAWVGPMALLVLDDQDDPTPYWLVSTRHPDRVLNALGIEASR